MRKIETKNTLDKKKKRNQMILGLGLIILMGLSVLGYSFMDQTDNEDIEKIDYNGIIFTPNSGYWFFTKDDSNFRTVYNPYDTENLSINIDLILSDYSEKQLYFAGYSGEAYTEIVGNFYQFLPKLPQKDVCLSGYNITCSDDAPIKNCSEHNVIIVTEPENNQENIYQEGTCIFINADYINQTKYADAFIFSVLEI